MNHYKIIKKLGEGVYGKVDLAKVNDKKYAIKIQEVDRSDLNENYKIKNWREIKFSYFT